MTGKPANKESKILSLEAREELHSKAGTENEDHWIGCSESSRSCQDWALRKGRHPSTFKTAAFDGAGEDEVPPERASVWWALCSMASSLLVMAKLGCQLKYIRK